MRGALLILVLSLVAGPALGKEPKTTKPAPAAHPDVIVPRKVIKKNGVDKPRPRSSKPA